ATPLIDLLRRCRLLEPDQLAEAEREVKSLPGGPVELHSWLVQRGWLTPYQHDLLIQGKGDEPLLGSYVLLNKLGEGGMGTVFKAKNWKLGKLVALKRLRSDRLQRPDAVRRFQHEIRAAATLNHPNVGLAYDADQVGDTHLFVMEYVEGTDLLRLLLERGPLPVAFACECVRQAALGLQHAHEHGLVHRDIKPQNLLLTSRGGALVKIADLGLVRMDASADGPSSGPLTYEGLLLGTCDYLAPEQADDAHAVDIRADLYSLGCTLYHLLAGEVPFPTRNAVHKLFLHRDGHPTPLEQLRPAVPPDVAAVVRRLMAKS